MVISEKAAPVPPKVKKGPSSGSDNILRAFRESCSQVDSSQLAVLPVNELSSKGSVVAAEVTLSAPLSNKFFFLGGHAECQACTFCGLSLSLFL